jgi:hypothetical protein
MGGWFGGKPELSEWLPMSVTRNGCGSAISSPRTPRPFGRAPMSASSWAVSPTVMNSERDCLSSASTPSAP